MFSIKKISLLAMAISALTSCAAPDPAGDDPASTEQTLGAACDNRQTFRFLTSAERLARLDDFIAKNPEWDQERLDYVVDGRSGDIGAAARRGPIGPSVSPTEADAEAAVRDFAATNWDYFGFLNAATVRAARATVRAAGPSELGGGQAWAVTLEGEETQSGYAHVVDALRRHVFSGYVGRDGLVRQVYTSGHVPTLTLNPRPATSPFDLGNLAHVLGYAIRYDHVPGPFEMPASEVHVDLGATHLRDLDRVELGLREVTEHDADVAILVHRFVFTVGAYEAVFEVDTCTRALLGKPRVRKSSR